MDYDKMSTEELKDELDRRALILKLNGGVETVEFGTKPALPKETPQEKTRREVTEFVKKRMAEEKAKAELEKKRMAEENAELEPSRTPASESEESRLLKALLKETQEGDYSGPALKEIDRRSSDPEFREKFINLRKSLYPSGVPGK